MKINPVVNFRARFDRTNDANAQYLKEVYNDVENTEREDDFAGAKRTIENLPDFTINIGRNTPEKDTFLISGKEINSPMEIIIPKKRNSESARLDSYIGLSRILNQLFS